MSKTTIVFAINLSCKQQITAFKKGGMALKNVEIKTLIKNARIFQWEVARQLGITEFTLCCWFRHELSDERKNRILQAIEELKAGVVQ